ncbi:MAG: TRAP transporter large permease [Rhodospirillaceae bacterium]|nr:TRAP transporter large permease [Rhodospirillaceae bacterium]
MHWSLAFGLLIGGLMVLMAIGLPVAFAFIVINIVGALIFLGGDAGLFQFVRNAAGSVTSFALVPIPLFLLMGEILFHTGLAQRAIDAVDRLIARMPGRLALVAITGGTIFAALSGSSMANTAMLGSTLMPEMKRRGYHSSMSMGPILGTGGIAILIPPSGLTVLLGSLANISISDLLIGGILPGVLIAALFFGYVILRCTINPALAPAYPTGALTLWQRIWPFIAYVLPLLVIFVVVVGSMLGGIATPSESAALGAVAAIIAAAAYGRLKWPAVKRSLLETGKISAMIFLIATASLTFSQILVFSGATQGLVGIVRDLNVEPFTLVVAMLLVLLLLGCFMDQLSMMMITLPFYMPLVRTLGIDPVWFGILMLLTLEIGFTTPPFGLLLFVMKGVAPPGTTMREIIAAATPFILLEFFAMVLILMLPALATWLPGMLR